MKIQDIVEAVHSLPEKDKQFILGYIACATGSFPEPPTDEPEEKKAS